jgi:Holliday junction resolvasome RuvABC endonuclease subunit
MSTAREQLSQYDRIIIGIDPGTNVMGYGLLGIRGKKPEMIAMGVIQLSKFESHYLRLKRIYERVQGLVEQYRGSVFWQECAVDAQIGTRARGGNGRSALARRAYHRI